MDGVLCLYACFSRGVDLDKDGKNTNLCSTIQTIHATFPPSMHTRRFILPHTPHNICQGATSLTMSKERPAFVLAKSMFLSPSSRRMSAHVRLPFLKSSQRIV